MKRKALNDMLFLLLLVEMYVVIFIIYEMDMPTSDTYSFVFFSILLFAASLSYLFGLLFSLYLSLIFVGVYGSYLLYMDIIIGAHLESLHYVFLIIPPLLNITIGSYSSKSKNMVDSFICMQQKFDHYVTIDEITGFENSSAFSDKLKKAISFSNRYKTNLCVLVLEVKYLEELRSIYNSADFDSIFREIANKIKQITRMEDHKYRLSDNMIAIILENSDEHGAEAVKQKLKTKMERIEIKKANNRTETIHVDYRIAVKQREESVNSVQEYLNIVKKELVYDV